MTGSTLTRAEVADLIHRHRLADTIYVTQPTMPSLQGYTELLEGIWERKRLTNKGPLHETLEAKLSAYLGVEHLSLFCNGTVALLVALEALGIDGGEVITTPFTFPATAHSLHWSRVSPVFCDIDPVTLNLDPDKIERLISPATRAILPVHVYGRPCNVEAIERIASAHGLRVIYDAAHAFGVRYKGDSVLKHGDISILSFHATKPFTTIEGGALVCGSESRRRSVNLLKNFGIADEETVVGPGINGKMNEFQAAFGLMQLDMVDQEIANRRHLTLLYRELLAGVPGVTCLSDIPDVQPTYAYFPVLIDAERFGMTRDELSALLRQCNIVARRYFYPLISAAPCYSAIPSAASSSLPVAERISRQVLCLPIYGGLDPAAVRAVCGVMQEAQHLSLSKMTFA